IPQCTGFEHEPKSFMFDRVLTKDAQLIRNVDPNFGFLLCYLHSRLYITVIGRKPTEAWYCGKVLRLRLDGSVKTVDVPLRSIEHEMGRCLWELLTDEPMPQDYWQVSGMSKICGGNILCAR
ncbi:MAG: hypothetical protein ACUVTY_14320, partial [Armatimonadota bacterium]